MVKVYSLIIGICLEDFCLDIFLIYVIVIDKGIYIYIMDDRIYWKDPLKNKCAKREEGKYITFEYDIGGWNNIRMALEIVFIFAYITGRTIVLPPSMHLYLLDKDTKQHSLMDFYDEKLFTNNIIRIISLQEYLQELPNTISKPSPVILERLEQEPLFNYWGHGVPSLFLWMREVGYHWRFDDKTFFTFMDDQVSQSFGGDQDKWWAAKDKWTKRFLPYRTLLQRGTHIMYILGGRMMDAPVWHFKGDGEERLIAHYTSKLYIECDKMNLYVRRFVRDSLRYHDSIFNIAWKMIDKLNRFGGGGGGWCSAHIRRGDFQFVDTRLSCKELLEVFKGEISVGKIIYIATDEPDKSFFNLLREYYTIYFWDDIIDMGIENSNWIGMIEQIIASHGEIFYGTYLSTFTHYIIRMRGYLKKEKNRYIRGEMMEEKSICSWEHEYKDTWENLD